jgi:hypothetical protein
VQRPNRVNRVGPLPPQRHLAAQRIEGDLTASAGSPYARAMAPDSTPLSRLRIQRHRSADFACRIAAVWSR